MEAPDKNVYRAEEYSPDPEEILPGNSHESHARGVRMYVFNLAQGWIISPLLSVQFHAYDYPKTYRSLYLDGTTRELSYSEWGRATAQRPQDITIRWDYAFNRDWVRIEFPYDWFEAEACRIKHYDLYNSDDHVDRFWIRTWDNGYWRWYNWMIRGTNDDSDWDATMVLDDNRPNEYLYSPVIFVVFEKGVSYDEGEARFKNTTQFHARRSIAELPVTLM